MNEMPITRRPCRIALLGSGTVGSAVAARLGRHRFPDLRLTHIFDRHLARARAVAGDDVVCTARVEDVLAADVDIIVETLGGLEPARLWMSEALARGRSVVTANKQVVARHGRALLVCAAAHGSQLRFEAAVGGAMPIVGVVGERLAGDRILRLDAVLNGTTTFVLSTIEAGSGSLADAIRTAQVRGYAEADVAADLDGRDAAAKLTILCALAFGVAIDVDAIERRPIEEPSAAMLADLRRRGRTIRQLVSASYDWDRGVFRASVGPRELPAGSFLGRTTDAGNAALIVCERAGTIGLFGQGAGGDAAAGAIISDLLAIAHAWRPEAAQRGRGAGSTTRPEAGEPATAVNR
jgi:homoserine dehydrogenase